MRVIFRGNYKFLVYALFQKWPKTFAPKLHRPISIILSISKIFKPIFKQMSYLKNIVSLNYLSMVFFRTKTTMEAIDDFVCEIIKTFEEEAFLIGPLICGSIWSPFKTGVLQCNWLSFNLKKSYLNNREQLVCINDE